MSSRRKKNIFQLSLCSRSCVVNVMLDVEDHQHVFDPMNIKGGIHAGGLLRLASHSRF